MSKHRVGYVINRRGGEEDYWRNGRCYGGNCYFVDYEREYGELHVRWSYDLDDAWLFGSKEAAWRAAWKIGYADETVIQKVVVSQSHEGKRFASGGYPARDPRPVRKKNEQDRLSRRRSGPRSRGARRRP
jgi:hypothetical protein